MRGPREQPAQQARPEIQERREQPVQPDRPEQPAPLEQLALKGHKARLERPAPPELQDPLAPPDLLEPSAQPSEVHGTV